MLVWFLAQSCSIRHGQLLRDIYPVPGTGICAFHALFTLPSLWGKNHSICFTGGESEDQRDEVTCPWEVPSWGGKTELHPILSLNLTPWPTQPVPLAASSQVQQHQHLLGACGKCKFLGPTPKLPILKPWDWDPEICIFINPLGLLTWADA